MQAAAAACLGAMARACLNEFAPYIYDSLQTLDRLAMGYHPEVRALLDVLQNMHGAMVCL